MGLLSWWSRVGSDPYYASYEKALQRIKDDIDMARVSNAVQGELRGQPPERRSCATANRPVALPACRRAVQRGSSCAPASRRASGQALRRSMRSRWRTQPG